MAYQLRRQWVTASFLEPLRPVFQVTAREFRSYAALEAIAKANEEKVPNLVLYNYPSFSEAFSALLARVFHARLNYPSLKTDFVFSSHLFALKSFNLLIYYLLEITSVDPISKGNLYISSRWIAASKLLDKVFKVRLGRGFHGECLGIRVDGDGHLSDEISKQLSIKSAAAGLRPIGAVVFMQRNNLKMCVRSTDSATGTSEVAKAYGGGGSPSSSSFMIRMDEYNQWYSVYTSCS